ncbi:hypothetical protein DOM21_05845 [Bacteriovorax stolpii]|uniref:Uncharacterized protein n=1 Tax=Bacteriovorax stolpii TaxID=960 RepID=A0A2K9NU26_BACTC|nr:hypothetical protein [Bacteriovorax stolpii]AUN99020.1 hypothetical protein C0V70_13095 [Bacteriovorax stolpii]QDK40984.1 hypothetical protein DOM21_05845 [Bacteriovorax stolpii]TDP55454.1 hypothetical protein C8D79_0504 [Bacteriovorax stolpii]
MKTTLTVLALTSLLATGALKAEEISLPVITKPAILEEGTQRTLTQAQIAELLPWAKDSKLFLIDLMENIQGLTTSDKIERLADGIASVVGESAPKNSELLMRYALNRGLVINDILSREMDADAVGSQDAKLRVLKASIEMAIKYYETDLAILEKKTTAPFVIFGLDYFDFLNELNKSIFDASAQYNVQRTALEWLQWDLYRDLNNASYAPQIVKINNSLKTFPNKKITDAQSIANIRLMKKVAQQLNVKSTLTKLEEERRLAMAKNDEERRLMIAKTEAEKERIRREAELERLRGSRSLVDIEKVKSYTSSLNSGGWETRRESANQLGNMVGSDVTLALLSRLMIESDSDVMNAIMRYLPARIDSPSYIMKIDSHANHRAQVISILSSASRSGGWEKRRTIARLVGNIPTIEAYRLLSSWLQGESDSDVKNAIVASMGAIESALK